MSSRRATRGEISVGMTYGILCLLAVLVFAPAAHAQQPVVVRAYVDNTTVSTREAVTYTLEIQGANPAALTRPQAPATENLALVSPTPSTQQSFRYRNGQMQRSVAFTWRYRPGTAGDARIDAASVSIAGTTYRTEAINLTVVSGGAPARNESIGGNAIFIDVEASDHSVYLKEPVRLTYRLYFLPEVDIRQSRMAGPWEAEGFWREDLEVERNPFPQTVVHNGRRYRTIVLKRAVVFPTHTGTLEVDPLPIESEIYDGTDAQSPFSRFFSFGRSYEPVEISSPRVRIDVRPLPEGAPASFAGAVGFYDVELNTTRRALEVGGATELRVAISGRGNISTLEAPVLEAPDAFEVYDPDVNVSLDRTGQTLYGEKTFTYVLVPQAEGAYTLPPVQFSWFNPATEGYETWRSDSLRFRVAPGDVANGTGVALSTDELAGPMLDAGNWEAAEPEPLYLQPWAYAALLAPWLALLGLLAFTRRRRHHQENPDLVRQSRAHSRAVERLEHARSLVDEGQTRRAYALMEEALLGYLEDKLNVPLHGLTQAEREARLAAAGMSESDRHSLEELLSAADRAQFAPVAASEPEADLKRSQKFIRHLDNARDTFPKTHAFFLLSALLICAAPAAASPSADSLFARGTRAVTQGDYREALDAYQAILSNDRTSGALYYNMGIAYYHLDELGQAIRYFEKARPYLPDDERLQHNLALARGQTVDQFANLPAPFWVDAWHSLVRAMGTGGLFALGFILYLIGYLLLGLRLLNRSGSRVQLTLQRLSLGAGILILIAAFAASVERAESSRAVVLAEEVPLRAQAQVDAASEELLHEGTVLHLLVEKPATGWTQVRLSNGATGWLPTSALGPI